VFFPGFSLSPFLGVANKSRISKILTKSAPRIKNLKGRRIRNNPAVELGDKFDIVRQTRPEKIPVRKHMALGTMGD